MTNNKGIQNDGCKNVQSQQNSGKLASKYVEVKINPEGLAETSSESTEKKENGLKRAIDNPDRLEPTRYGDWEKNGRCIDF